MKRPVLAVSLILEKIAMKSLSRIVTVGLLVLGACSSSTPLDTTASKPGEPTTNPTSNPTSTTTDYIMRFEGFSPVEGLDGLKVGGTTNLRFAFDLQKPDQTYYPPPASSVFLPSSGRGQVTPRIITFFELGSYCDGGNTDPSVAFPPEWLTLPTGDTAWVEHLDLTMASNAPARPDGSAPEEPGSGSMCYGYRLGGAWYWDLTPRQATWDPATQTYQLRLTIQKGPIDALKVLSNNGQAHRFLDRMVLATKPQLAV